MKKSSNDITIKKNLKRVKVAVIKIVIVQRTKGKEIDPLLIQMKSIIRRNLKRIRERKSKVRVKMKLLVKQK